MRSASHRPLLALVAALAPCAPATAQAAAQATSPAAGVELSASTDSDDFDVVKLAGRMLWRSEGRDKYQGLVLERAWFRADGHKLRTADRVYLDLADKLGSDWRWRARLGTDGHIILGSATIRSADWSKEVFLERDLVESAEGVRKGLSYTLLGGSFDLPAGKTTVFNLGAAVQEFTGSNERLQLRGSYIRVVEPKLGLSAQLRVRYFHSTRPGEVGYFSPRDFVQFLPVAQVRRFDRKGWMYLAAVGYGLQKSTGSKWQQARFADLRIESPPARQDLQLFAQLQYSNNSISGAGANYSYVIGRAGLTKRF